MTAVNPKNADLPVDRQVRIFLYAFFGLFQKLLHGDQFNFKNQCCKKTMRDGDELVDVIAENDDSDHFIRQPGEYVRSPNQSFNPFPLRGSPASH